VRIAYVSLGNVPSRWAHTVQSVKMAEALAARCADLVFLTSGTWLPGPVRRVDWAAWYGVELRFRVWRLPVRLAERGDVFSHVDGGAFDAAAALSVRALCPDLVYARSPRAGAWCARLGIPTVIENHTETDSRFFAPIARAAALPALRGVVTVTEHLGDRYRKEGVPPGKLLVWPDAVDPRRFRDPPDRATARLALDLPVEARIALYCGHFYPEKGVPELAEAARRTPEVLFVFVGGWPADAEALRARLSGVPNARVLPFVPNRRVPLHLAAADALVLPNSGRGPQAWSTSPLKLFEYMAAGRPVVATDIPALRGFLRHGWNACVVAPDAPDALADGVRRVLGDPAWADGLARTARAEVRAYTWERRAEAVLERFVTTPPEIGLP